MTPFRCILLLLSLLLSIPANGQLPGIRTETMRTGRFQVAPESPYAIEIGCGTNMALEVKAELKTRKTIAGEAKNCWGILGTDSLGNEIFRIELRHGVADPLDSFTGQYLQFSLYLGGEQEPCRIERFHENVGLYGQPNTLSIEIDNGNANIWLGAKEQMFAGSFPCTEIHRASIFAKAKLEVRLLVVKEGPQPFQRDTPFTASPPTEICHAAEMTRCARYPICGEWRWLDSDYTREYAEPGGSYTLAIVPADLLAASSTSAFPSTSCSLPTSSLYGDGSETKPEYALLYIAGATRNPSAWQPGQIKALLYPTPFLNHFRLLWVDSFGNVIADSVTADLDTYGIFSIAFPLYRATLRLSRPH